MNATPTETLPGIIAKALIEFPYTDAADWRLVGKAAIHKDVELGDDAVFTGPAIIRGGTIWGGTIRGGTIWGGTALHKYASLHKNSPSCTNTLPKGVRK